MSQRYRKAEVYALVADLHAAGVRTSVVIASVLGISERYVRTVLANLKAGRIRNAEQALDAIDTQLRLRIREFRNSD